MAASSHLQGTGVLLEQIQQSSQAQAPLIDQLTQHQAQVVLSDLGSWICVCGWQQKQQQGICTHRISPVHLARARNVEQICKELLDRLWVRLHFGLYRQTHWHHTDILVSELYIIMLTSFGTSTRPKSYTKCMKLNGFRVPLTTHRLAWSCSQYHVKLTKGD